MCPKRVSVREEGEGHIPCRGTNDRKDAGTNSRESGMRNQVIGSIRSRAESTGGCVKLKTVTEMRQNSTHDVFTAKSVYLVLNSLLDWEPVERLKQRNDVVSYVFFSMRKSTAPVLSLVNTFFDTFCKVLLHLVLTQLKRTACHVHPFCLFPPERGLKTLYNDDTSHSDRSMSSA